MFARITFQLPEATRPRIVTLPVVADRSTLLQYLVALQQWSCARITQAEMVELVDFDGVSAGSDYTDFDYSSLLTLRDATTWEPFRVVIPAPALKGLEKDYKNTYRVTSECGDALALKYGPLINRDLNFDGGALT